MTLAITVREAKAALAEMKKLTPARPRLDDDTKLSLKEVVFLMASDLAVMIKRGFTLKELADGLQIQNIHIKPATLNRYLNEYKAGQAETEVAVKISPEELKEPPASSGAGTPQETAEAIKTSEAENRTEEITQTGGASPASETEREKSEEQSPYSQSLFWNSQKQNLS